MYQLIQIPLQNFFLYFMYQPQHLSYFKIFFCILCTNRSPSPVDLHSNETSADPHHDTDTQHQSTRAPPHTRRHVPTPLSALPYSQPYNRTTAPPYNRTTAPYPGPADTPLQIQHTAQPCRTTAPHPQIHHSPTMQPHRFNSRRPDRRSIDAAPAATGARVAAGPPPTLATALARRVDVRTPSRRRPDTVTPLAVLVYRTRLQYLLVAVGLQARHIVEPDGSTGRHHDDSRHESGTGHMRYTSCRTRLLAGL